MRHLRLQAQKQALDVNCKKYTQIFVILLKNIKIRNEILYIVQCKQNYFDGICPADPDVKEKSGYHTLIKIAKYYFDNALYDDFAQYFMEGQYFIQLWTAHLILEYGQPDQKLRNRCLDVIVKYTDNPLATKVAIQEKKWLESCFYL